MINTCLNVNKIIPQNPTKKYAKMTAGEEPSSEESVSERHDTVDEPGHAEQSIPDDYVGSEKQHEQHEWEKEHQHVEGKEEVNELPTPILS